MIMEPTESVILSSGRRTQSVPASPYGDGVHLIPGSQEATDVERIVKDAYEDVAVAKVTHMHSLQKSKVFTEDQRADMLMNPALTTSLPVSSSRLE